VALFLPSPSGKTRVKVQTKDAAGKAVTTAVVKDRVRAPATVVRYMAALSHALNTAVTEWGWLEKSPMVGVKKPKVDNERRSFLSDEEIQRVLTAAKESENRFLHTIVLLALSTGMRQSEIMTLRWRNVLIEDGADMGLLVMEKTKNGDARTAPLAEDAFTAVMALRDKAIKNNAGRVPAGQLLFPSDTVDNKPVEIRKAWETCRKRAGLDDFRFHDLRHTAGSLLAMSGASHPRDCRSPGSQDHGNGQTLLPSDAEALGLGGCRHESAPESQERMSNSAAGITSLPFAPGNYPFALTEDDPAKTLSGDQWAWRFLRLSPAYRYDHALWAARPAWLEKRSHQSLAALKAALSVEDWQTMLDADARYFTLDWPPPRPCR